METILIVVSGVVFFAIGLAIGLFFARQARAAAALETRQELTQQVALLQQQLGAREGDLAELSAEVAQHQQQLDADRHRAMGLVSELARAKAGADQAAQLKQTLDSTYVALDEERKRASTVAEQLARALAELEAERRAAAERSEEAERTREQVRAEVEMLAGRVLDEKGKAILNQNRVGLEALLKPVSEKLREFEAKVEKTYDQENRDRASLLTSLQKMQDAQAKLTKDAENLTRALTGESKTQGDWGELVLERILETAGLTEGREYDLQVNHVDEDGGRKRPDALVYLPSNRVVIVDAKCSLTAFVHAMSAETEEGREAALDAHLASVRTHVKSLSSKSYQDVVKERTLDIVLLFIPNEAAFHAAIGRDTSLYDEAFRQRVVICSPTTLLAALQLISHVWRSEKQNLNAQKIAEEAGKLLEKLGAFVEDLDEVGTRLGQAQSSFATARAKLSSGRGNVIKRAADLVKLGARVRPDKMEPLMLEAADDDGADLLALPRGFTTPESSGGAPVS
jgi:DNA recombination protein RmuC